MTGVFIRRPVSFLFLVLLILFLINLQLYHAVQTRGAVEEENRKLFDITTTCLGLSDLCVATEARYTRHPAVSDPVVPFMDHPGSIEHFPTGSFWSPPSLKPSRIKQR